MINCIVLIALILLELLYFRIADKFNIIDKPNFRSSHTTITLRGGGVIFYFAVLIYFVSYNYSYPWFFLGLTMMTIISFLDDLYSLSNKLRLFFHFCSVLLLAKELNVFLMDWYYLIGLFIVVVGVVNSYNFMDGINGITASYSIAIISVLIFLNNKINFIDQNLLIFVLMSLFVFAFFNFRINAKSFAGDVGSVAIAYIILLFLGSLILKTNNLIYILLLSIYGVDTAWTIFQRLVRRENIFEAHRTHLYQFLANEAGFNKLYVSLSYGLLQFFIGVLVVFIAEKDMKTQFIFTICLLIFLSIVYLIVKRNIVSKYVKVQP